MRYVSILIIASGLLHAVSTEAQHQTRFLQGKNDHWRQSEYQILKSQQENQQKTTAAKERLVADSYTAIGIVTNQTDSTRYVYTGNNGSSYDFTQMAYVNYGTSAEVRFDTAAFFTGTLGVLAPSSRTVNSFTAMWHVDTSLSQIAGSSGWINNLRYRSTYDNQGNEKERYAAFWDTTVNAWIEFSRMALVYNSGNQRIRDSLYAFNGTSWQLFFIFDNTYDGSGNLVEILRRQQQGAALVNYGKTTNSYYSGNLLKTSLFQLSSNTGWGNMYKDSFAYNSTTFPTSHVSASWDSATSSWVPDYYEYRHLNSSLGLPDSVYYNVVGSYEGVDVFAYTQLGNPALVTSYNTSGGVIIGNPLGETSYYYELYDFPATVKDTRQGVYKIYPNPATELLNIDQLSGRAATRLSVVDIQGRTLITEHLHANNTTVLDVSRINSGMYWVLLMDEQGTPLHQQTIVKQ